MICGVDVKRDESPYDLVKTLAQKNSLDRRGAAGAARAVALASGAPPPQWRRVEPGQLPARRSLAVGRLAVG